MRLKGEAYSRRLEEFSRSTLVLMSEIMSSTEEAALAMSDITTNSELTEDQVVEQLKELLKEHEAR